MRDNYTHTHTTRHAGSQGLDILEIDCYAFDCRVSHEEAISRLERDGIDCRGSGAGGNPGGWYSERASSRIEANPFGSDRRIVEIVHGLDV